MKKAAKIVLLAVLLALVGGIVYTVLTWPTGCFILFSSPKPSWTSRSVNSSRSALVMRENGEVWVEARR